MLDSHSNLINHIEKIHVHNEGKNRDHLFPQKCPNCPKWIYHDDEMRNIMTILKNLDDVKQEKKKSSPLRFRGPCDPADLCSDLPRNI